MAATRLIPMDRARATNQAVRLSRLRSGCRDPVWPFDHLPLRRQEFGRDRDLMDISADLLRYGKRDNSKAAEKAKTAIRLNVLQAMGEAHVFDAFAGEGAMHRAVWHQAASYVGCDKQFFRDDRAAFVADNRRVLRAIDLRQFTVFDFDSWGSPWEQMYLLAARRPVDPGELIGVVLTEGLGLKMNMGGISKPLGKLAKVKTHMPGMGAARDDLIERALREVCRMMQCEVVKRWQAQGNKGSRVSYIALVLRGLSSS